MIELPSPSPHIQAFIDGSIAWMVLNRPERRNALNAAMWAAIPPLMKSLDSHVDVRVIVIRGKGSEAFSRQFDLWPSEKCKIGVGFLSSERSFGEYRFASLACGMDRLT